MNIIRPEKGIAVLEGLKITAKKLLVKDEVEAVHLQIAPGASLPVHATPVEVFFYVLEGEGEIEVGDERLPVGADTMVESPKMVPHGLHNTGKGPFRVLVVKTPRPI